MALTCVVKKILIFVCLLTATESFEIGTERTFSFVNDVSLYDLKTAIDQSFGYRITGDLKVSAIYGDNDNGFLLRYELLSPQLYLEKFKVSPIDYEYKKSILDEYKKLTFYAHWKEGIIEKAFFKDTKDSSLANFLRSILSLFQYQLVDKEGTEKDVTGTCQVRYITKSSTKVMKIKTGCENGIDFHERTEKPLGCESRITRINVIETSADGQLDSVHSSDHHKFAVNAYKNVGFKTGSLFFLKLDTVKDCKTLDAENLEAAINTLDGYKEATLLPDIPEDQSKDSNLVKLIKETKENLKNEDVGKEKSALAYLSLIAAGRKSKGEELIRIINGRSTKEIRGQIMDMLAGIQTDESYMAFRTTMNFTDDEHVDNIERYLQSLSVGSRPRQSIISHLLETFKGDEVSNEKIRETLIHTISSMANKFANLPGQDYGSQVVKDVRDFLMKSIDECNEDSCKMVYIRGLQNLQSPDTLDKLMELALKESYKVSVAAMKALSRLHKNDLSARKQDFKRIFYQRQKKFDTSARTLALDILLRLDPDTIDVIEFVEHLKSADTAYEVKQYLVQQLRMMAEQCSSFNELLMTVLRNDPKVFNWNTYGALKGLSTALSRKFSQYPAFNSSVLSVQEIKGGVLKRGNMDLMMEYEEEKFSAFTLGLFAGGLSSFVSNDEEEDPNEDTTATAGMELAIQGNYLRPLVFFKGQGELMGHVWSGTASEPTSAYQGITLLQDQNLKIVLNNGAILDYSTLGAISIDLNGKISISLWYKNANLEVLQNMGLGVLSSVRISSPIVSADLTTSVAQEPQINLASKIDFSSKTAICLQIMQPNIVLSQKISRSIDIPKSKKEKTFRHEAYLRYKIPGHTYVLNQKNNDMCNSIMEN